MNRPFEGKCMNCAVDKQGCVFDQNPQQCTWCIRQRYKCSETEVDSRRRKLSSFKCDHCREKHHKCVPEGRQWPQRCNFCKERDLPCSPPRSRRARSSISSPSGRRPSVSPRRNRSPSLQSAGSISPEGSDMHLSPIARDEHQHQGHTRSNSLDHDLLHPPFLGLMDLQLDISGFGDLGPHLNISPFNDSAGLGHGHHDHNHNHHHQHHHHAGAPRRLVAGDVHIHVTPAGEEAPPLNIVELPSPNTGRSRSNSATTTITTAFSRLDTGPVDLLELPYATKRRLIHFLYAADEPIPLTQFSAIPAIDTTAKVFDPRNILPLHSDTAGQYLSLWFGKFVIYDAGRHTVKVCDEGRAQGSTWFLSNFSRFFLSAEEAHAETLYVCATYLSFLSGGSREKSNGGMGFQFSDENDLSSMVQRLGIPGSTRGTGYSSLSPSATAGNPEIYPFYSLLEYATLNWPRHLARITPVKQKSFVRNTEVTLSAFKVVGFILSFQYFTWLESLCGILGVNDQSSEAIALAQANVLGVFKRWVQASSRLREGHTNIKLCFRALHWLDLLQSVDILGQVQSVSKAKTDVYNTLEGGKHGICQRLQAKFLALGSFEAVSQRDCELIGNAKFDPDYWKFIIKLIGSAREPCVVDVSSRLVWYVYQHPWSGGALQLECVDLETGLILGRDSIWTKRFFGWKQRVIVAKSASYLGLQVVAEKKNLDQVQSLLITCVWPLRDLQTIKLGQSILGESWVIDNDLQTLAPGQATSDLYQQGQLIFGIDGFTVQTPRGTWDLRTRTRLGNPSMIVGPTVLAQSDNGAYEVHAEWDVRMNSCTRIYLKESVTRRLQQISPHLGPFPGQTNAVIKVCYAGFNTSGTKLLLQIQSSSILEPNSTLAPPELTWYLWEYQPSTGLWVLQIRQPTHENEFWPLLNSEGIFDDMGSICSVHRVVDGTFLDG